MGFSRVRPALYTYVFISCDVTSILLQAIGGALASAAEDNALLDIGDHVMLSGLVFQVFTLVVFGICAADYICAIYRNRNRLNPATARFRQSLRFKLFIVALWVAYLGILTRCSYRVAELAGGIFYLSTSPVSRKLTCITGWVQNPILREQGLFIGLDSVPVGISAVALNIWHPGWCFPMEEQDTSYTMEKLGSRDEEAQL